jgi:hypothetical protein
LPHRAAFCSPDLSPSFGMMVASGTGAPDLTEPVLFLLLWQPQCGPDNLARATVSARATLYCNGALQVGRETLKGSRISLTRSSEKRGMRPCDLTGNAHESGSFSLVDARIAGDLDYVPGGPPFGELSPSGRPFQ